MDLESRNIRTMYHTLVEESADVIFRLDGRGRILFVNNAVRIYGFEPGDIIGRYHVDLVHPDDRRKAEHLLSQRIKGMARRRSYTLRLTMPDGRCRTFEVRSVAVVSDDEVAVYGDRDGIGGGGDGRGILFIQGIARDVTGNDLRERETRRRFRALRARLGMRDGRRILPICSHCRRLLTPGGDWISIETYVAGLGDTDFSHGVCPECLDSYYSNLETID